MNGCHAARRSWPARNGAPSSCSRACSVVVDRAEGDRRHHSHGTEAGRRATVSGYPRAGARPARCAARGPRDHPHRGRSRPGRGHDLQPRLQTRREPIRWAHLGLGFVLFVAGVLLSVSRSAVWGGDALTMGLRVASNELEELRPTLWIGAERAGQRRGHRSAGLLLDAAHHHAEVDRLDDHGHSERFERLVQRVAICVSAAPGPAAGVRRRR